jgi:pyrroline-5-carboxylate reductase
MKKFKVAILGGGNIGTALARGLILSETFTKEEILITDKQEQRTSALKGMGFNVINDNCQAVAGSEIIIITVKPQQFISLAEEIKPGLRKEHILVSSISGISLKSIESTLGPLPILRIMPNIALEICESMTCMTFRNTSSKQEEKLLSIFGNMGKTLVVHEDLLDASTVIGACGVAFALRFMRAMSQGGIEIGFDSEMSQLITAQTVKAAARLILEKSNHPEREIDRVTTPQGITISGLNEMEHQGLSSAVIKGITTSFAKLENLNSKKQK